MTQPSQALVKAFIEVLEGADKGTTIPCFYNPEKVGFSRGNNWEAKQLPGKPVSKLLYTGASAQKMNISLVFDTTDSGKSVMTTYTDKLLKLMDTDPKIGAPKGNTDKSLGQPPKVTFGWGTFRWVPAVINSANVTFDYWSADAIPLRATVDLSLTESTTRLPGTNPTSGTPTPGTVHRVQRGETLDRISAHYYGDATRWRVLATANGLEDPLALRPGSLIDIPQPDN